MFHHSKLDVRQYIYTHLTQYINTERWKRLSLATIGHNRMTLQPSCLQCKQAHRDCVSRSRLFVAAWFMFCVFVRITADVALSLCPSCILGRGGDRGADCVTLWCLLYGPDLGFELLSIIIQQCCKQTGLGRGRDCTPDGYFPLLTCQCLFHFL